MSITRVLWIATLAGICMPLCADVYDRAQMERELQKRRGTTGTASRVAAPAPAPAPAAPASPSLPTGPPRGQVQRLEMMPEDQYRALPQAANVQTVSVWRVMSLGLGRGFCNITTWPAELVRGFSYEFTAREWYWALGTSWLAGLGGGVNRCCAGMADIFTCGYYGDIKLAQSESGQAYPDFVWQGDWVYHPTPTYRTRETSSGPERMRPPERDIKPGTSRTR
jgi:hypothetical protein